MRISWKYFCTVSLVLAPCLLSGQCAVGRGADLARVDATATGLDTPPALGRSASVAWSGTPLKQALNGLAEAHGLGLVIDRRIDPGQPIELVLEAPLAAVFEAVAQRCGAGVGVVGQAVYFGPPSMARRIATLAALREDEIRGMTPAVQQRFLPPTAWQWDDFTTPRKLFDRLADVGDVGLAGPTAPHDLWAGVRLPSASLAQVFTLVAAQFDWTFTLDDQASVLRLKAVPDNVVLVRHYPAPGRLELLAQQWRRAAPQSDVEPGDGEIVVRGPVEDHQRIASLGRSPAEAPKNGEVIVDRMNVDAPLGAVLRRISQTFQLEMRIDEAALERAGISLDIRVALQVENATLDELLDAALGSAGLVHRRRGSIVEIHPRSP